MLEFFFNIQLQNSEIISETNRPEINQHYLPTIMVRILGKGVIILPDYNVQYTNLNIPRLLHSLISSKKRNFTTTFTMVISLIADVSVTYVISTTLKRASYASARQDKTVSLDDVGKHRCSNTLAVNAEEIKM